MRHFILLCLTLGLIVSFSAIPAAAQFNPASNCFAVSPIPQIGSTGVKLIGISLHADCNNKSVQVMVTRLAAGDQTDGFVVSVTMGKSVDLPLDAGAYAFKVDQGPFSSLVMPAPYAETPIVALGAKLPEPYDKAPFAGPIFPAGLGGRKIQFYGDFKNPVVAIFYQFREDGTVVNYRPDQGYGAAFGPSFAVDLPEKFSLDRPVMLQAIDTLTFQATANIAYMPQPRE